ncbi:sulfite exporter TauE/SafE family protein [Akkermansiaceae bacterium]|nr:sulfite exporter TauE/SafE family protein [Akkermansiaceae bacterium]
MESSMTVVAALATGLVTSVHCVAMCGPLACSVGQANRGETRTMLSYLGYHFGRLISYSSIGAICGALGEQPLRWIFGSPALVLPWLLVALFLITALGLWRKLPRPRWIDHFVAKARLRSFKLTAGKGAMVMGLVTPLLPCGPLYLLFAACLLSGSALTGAEFALAFGMGTIPLLWVAQHSFSRLKQAIPQLRFQQIQRSLALIAALVMVWRLHDTLPDFGPPPEAAAADPELPTCCH